MTKPADSQPIPADLANAICYLLSTLEGSVDHLPMHVISAAAALKRELAKTGSTITSKTCF